MTYQPVFAYEFDDVKIVLILAFLLATWTSGLGSAFLELLSSLSFCSCNILSYIEENKIKNYTSA